MSNYDTTDHILWPYDEEEEQEYDAFDAADLEYAQRKIDELENS